MSALLALSSSLLWGSGDYLGGRASRGWGVLRVLCWSQIAMFVLIWIVVAIGAGSGVLEVTAHGVAVGALGGVAGVIALGAFYRALAIGPMSVVPPIAATGVALPIVVGLARGAAPSPLVLLGIAAAVCGVVLASVGEGDNDDAHAATRIAPRTLGLCLVAATGFGLIFVAMDAAAGASAGTALVATAGVRAGSFATLLIVVLLTRARPWAGVSPRSATGFVGIGLLDTSANLAFATAAAMGDLAIVAVLGSLYPAVTSGLAHVLLGERLGRLQLVGVALAIGGVVVLASR